MAASRSSETSGGRCSGGPCGLSGDPKANLAILGDFNEGEPVGSDSRALAVLFQAKPPMVDALSTLSRKISTHTDGKAYDRILVSDAIARGLNRRKLEQVVIQPHRHGKGEARRLYTDHFPVAAMLRLERDIWRSIPAWNPHRSRLRLARHVTRRDQVDVWRSDRRGTSRCGLRHRARHRARRLVPQGAQGRRIAPPPLRPKAMSLMVTS
jgi:hypothetical protein